MAKKINPLDALFKEKLIDHQVVPSIEAWQKIEANLPAKSRSLYIYWWASAASIAGVWIAIYLLTSNPPPPTGNNQLTAKRTGEIMEKIAPKPDRSTFQPAEQPAQGRQKTISKPEKKTQKPLEKRIMKELDLVQPEINLQLAQLEDDPKLIFEKNPKLEQQVQGPLSTVDQIVTSEPTNLNLKEEPLYRVNIYSKGIKKENSPKNLLTELHKTVNRAENILDKVDDGLSIQQIRTSLIQTLGSKKEKQSEKP